MPPLDATAPYEQASATLLSQQPLTLPERPEKAGEDWETTFAHLEARLNVLRSWRSSWWSHWARLAEYFLPRRFSWVVTANRMSKGGPINEAIVDSTATLAIQTCASGLWTGLMSPSRPWFKLAIGLPWITLDAEGKAWLEDTEQRIYTVLAQSNFYTVMAQAFQDVVVFGTAPVVIYEDFEDVIRCYLPSTGQYFLAVGSRFSVDTQYWEEALTVTRIVERFQLENCPQQVRELWAKGGANLETELVIACAIEPNFPIAKHGQSGGSVAPIPGSFTYREIYWLKGQKTNGALSQRGFNGRPFMVARWATTANDPYGRSPCMDALGDQKQVQLETRRKAEFIEKLVRPPMGANPELKNEPSSIIPGMITYVSTDGGKKGFYPLLEMDAAAFGPLTQDIEKVSARLEKCLFVDIFMAISRMEGVQPRNELELTKRDLERLQALGPFVELFETEFAGPAIQRVLEILQRRRMLKAMPQSLAGVPLKIDYQSILKLAQRASETVAMKDFAATMGGLSSAAKAAGVPDPLRCVNLDEYARHYADLSNLKPSLLFTAQEVTEHDAIRQKARQQAQLPGQAMAAVTAAKTLSETQLGGGSALGALTGQPPAPGG